MIYLGFFLLGGILGSWIRHYLQHFAAQLEQQLHQNYCEVFATENPMLQSVLTPIKCGAFWRYFFAFGIFFVVCAQIFPTIPTALCAALACSLLFLIAKLDWHYQLIAVEYCQLLFALALAAAYWHILPISLEQSLHSFALGFVAFWAIFHLAKYYYGAEAFGRGDYWLIAALSSFQTWQALPLSIFLSSSFALIFVLVRKKARSKFVPFAPFLALGHIFSFGLNVLGLAPLLNF